MAKLTGDDHFILGREAPPKDVTQGTGDPTLTAGDDDVSFWVNTPPNINLVQSLVGDLEKCLRHFLSESLKGTAIETWVSIPVGGADNDVVATAPAAGSVGVLIGANSAAGDKSHFVDRTFKRLREKLLEAGKLN